jgi:hypothetical protein
MAFQKVHKKVQDDRREKNLKNCVGNWGNVCSISSADRSDDEENGNSVARTNSGEVHMIFEQRANRFSAPLFGPPRKYGKGKIFGQGKRIFRI